MDTFRSTDLCETLRQAILQGDYKFGTRLKIDEIARRYGVSHMPVRKALLQLEGEQLVTTSRNRGASVRAIDVEFVGNTYDIVIPLEALLTRRATERMTPLVLRAPGVQAGGAGGRPPPGSTGPRWWPRISVSTRSSASMRRNPEAARIVDRSQELLRAIRRAFGFDPARLPGMIADHARCCAPSPTGTPRGRRRRRGPCGKGPQRPDRDDPRRGAYTVPPPKP